MRKSLIIVENAHAYCAPILRTKYPSWEWSNNLDGRYFFYPAVFICLWNPRKHFNLLIMGIFKSILTSAYEINFWGFFRISASRISKGFMEERYRLKHSKLSGASQWIRIWTDVFVLQNRALKSSGNFCANICVQHSGAEEVLTVPSLTCFLRFSRDALIIFWLHFITLFNMCVKRL